MMGYTTREVAEILGVSVSFVVSLIHRNKIKARKHGPVWVIDPASVAAYKKAPKAKGGRPRKNK